MGFDLDKIGEPVIGGPKPPKKSSGGFNLDKISDVASGTSPLLGGTKTDQQFADFRFQPKTNTDNYLLRAQDQGFMETLGKGVVNAVANTATGLVEGLGYIPELWDNDHDYSNALTRSMQAIHNPAGELYREHPDQTFDWKDSAWWVENMQQLGESAGAFAIEGIGLAKVFGKVAEGAAELATLGKPGLTAIKVAHGAAEVASGATLAFTEGAMSGYRIYDDAYKANYLRGLASGMTHEDSDASAKKIAGNAAATTVRMNTIMNTLLNVGALTPLFKQPESEVLDWIKTKGARQEGETLGEWKGRLQQASFEDPALKQALMPRHGYSSLAAESIKEGIEEVNTQYAEAEGRRVADGKNRGLAQSLTDVGQYFSDVTDQEGALNFILGAFGGMAQTAIIDHIPSRRIVKMDAENNPIYKKSEDGKMIPDSKGGYKYETKLVTPKTYTEFGTKQYFDSIKDSILTDIDFHQNKKNELLQAQAKGDQAAVEKIKNQIFAVGALDAVNKGLTSSWQKTYQDIAKTDNVKKVADELDPQVTAAAQAVVDAREQGADKATLDQLRNQYQALIAQQTQLGDTTAAMQQGFAKSREDNAYKERAESAVQDLKHLQELHEMIQQKYVHDVSPISGEVADHLFFRHADLYLNNKAIQKESTRIAKIESMVQASQLVDAHNFESSINDYNLQVGVLNDTLNNLDKDRKAIATALGKKDTVALKNMIEKYRAKGATDGDIISAADDLVSKINQKYDDYKESVHQAKENLKISSGFTKWLANNEGGKFEDYTNRVVEDSLLRADKANLEAVKVQHDIASQNLKELLSEKGLRGIAKSLAENRTKLIKSINDRNKNDNLAAFLRQQTKEASAKIDAAQKNILTQRAQELVTKLQNQVNAKVAEVNRLQQELKETLNKGKGVFKNFNKLIKLRQDLQLAKNSLNSLQAQLGTAQERLQSLGIQHEVAQQNDTTVENQTHEDQEGEDPNGDISFEMEDEEQAPTNPDALDDALNSVPQSNFEESDLAPTADDYPSDAIGDYMKLKDKLSPRALEILDKLEETFSGAKMSLQTVINAFQPLVNSGAMETADVNNILITMKDYLAAKMNPVSDVNKVYPLSEVQDKNLTDVLKSYGLYDTFSFLSSYLEANHISVSFTGQHMNGQLPSVASLDSALVNGKLANILTINKSKFDTLSKAEKSEVIAHEFVHGLIQLKANEKGTYGDKNSAFYKDLRKIFNDVKAVYYSGESQQNRDVFDLLRKNFSPQELNDLGGKIRYMESSIEEFATLGSTDPAVLKFLRLINEDRLSNTVSDFLGIPNFKFNGLLSVAQDEFGTNSNLTAQETSIEGNRQKELNALKSGIPALITRKLEAELKGYGFTQEQIDKMTPIVANEAAINAKYDAQRSDTQSQGIQTDDIPVEIPEGQPEIVINESIFTEEGLHDSYWEMSAKATEAVKANAADLVYTTIVDKKTGRIMLRNDMVGGGPVLDEHNDHIKMKFNSFPVGEPMHLEIDTNWVGQIGDDHLLEQDEYLHDEKRDDRFENYTDETGKIRVAAHEASIGYGNVPIKIVHTKSKRVVGYLPRVDWITATKGAGNYRNVEDLLPENGNGNRLPGNVELQSKWNLLIRKKLSELHNAEPGAKLSTQVKDRTTGRIMYAGEMNPSTGKVKYKTMLAKNLLPDSKLLMGVSNKSGFLLGKGVPAVSRLNLVSLTPEQQKRIQGAPVVYIPLPNGQHQPVPLQTTKFSDRKGDVNTVVRAIELHLQAKTFSHNPKLVDDIAKHTGFDITKEQGLKDFIQQYYTHLTNFEDSRVKVDGAVVDGEKVQKFMISISGNGKSTIKVGTAFSGRSAAYANLVNGKLDPRFVQALTTGLSNRFKNVALTDGDIKGVNSTGKISEVRIQSDGKGGEKVVPTHYDSYNDYMKSFTYTSVFGKHQVGGEYVYAANSQVILNKEMLSDNDSSLDLVDEMPFESTGNVEDDDFLRSLQGFENNSFHPTAEPTIEPKGDELTLSNLEDIRTLTPEETRNNLTADEILTRLQTLGISKIADGYNPFIKC